MLQLGRLKGKSADSDKLVEALSKVSAKPLGPNIMQSDLAVYASSLSIYPFDKIEKAFNEYRIRTASVSIGKKTYSVTAYPYIDESGYTYTHKLEVCEWDVGSTIAEIDQVRNVGHDCFFGEHLINQYPDAEIVIVAHPKIAVLMAVGLGFSRELYVATKKPVCAQDLNRKGFGNRVAHFCQNKTWEDWQAAHVGLPHIQNANN